MEETYLNMHEYIFFLFLLPLPIANMPCPSIEKRDNIPHGLLCEGIELCPLPRMTLIQSLNTNPMENMR